MESVSTTVDVRRLVDRARREGRSIGFVPTMGALHEGHTSLIEQARADGHFVVVSIFVNPLQFNDSNDLASYPKSEKSDDELCRSSGVDVLYLPQTASIYPVGFETRVVPGSIAEGFEGRHRAGHFEGVTTVVTKLFNMVQPDVAYFGRKDHQQLAVVRRMVRDLDVRVAIVGCPTIREHDGLAMSSRNVKLTPSARQKATALYRSLQAAVGVLSSGGGVVDARKAGLEVLSSVDGLVVDYFELVHRDTLEPASDDQLEHVVILVAATIGGVRLIDNMDVTEGSS
jgi:pantoate--beta-alanine ligase